jgi:hypothetical protein
MRLLIVVMAAALGGCVSSKEIPTAQPVKVVGSDLCKIQRKKITWDVKDTRLTIQQVRQLNAKWDARCGSQETS